MSLNENAFFLDRAEKLNAIMGIASMGRLKRATKALDREVKLHLFREPGAGVISYKTYGFGETLQFHHNPEYAQWAAFEAVLKGIRRELPEIAAEAARRPSMRLRDYVSLARHDLLPDFTLLGRRLQTIWSLALMRTARHG